MMIPNVDAYWLNGVEYNSINEIVSTPSGNSENKIVDPNASGKIIQKQNNFKLYGGNLIPVTIFVEMNNFIHNPTLTIFHNEILIKTIYPRSGGNLFQSTIGLDDNWKSGIYQINLNHQNKVLDISSFVITRDNESFEEKIFHELTWQLHSVPFNSVNSRYLVSE